MRLLLTGHDGYIGRVLAPMLLEAGHEVVGLDSALFDGCDFGRAPAQEGIRALRVDVRDVTPDHLTGFDAVLHLAGISNDPLGDLAPDITLEINHQASVRLAELAKRAGVRRFLFASSCSNYGAAGDAVLDETAGFSPVTPYAVSKVKVELDLKRLADADFSPVYLRAATAYGVSARLRGDLVVNNLVGYAVTTGQVLIKSDGTPWRPLVHIEDIARAYLALVEAPREVVHDQAFNVGDSAENYRVREVAETVAAVVPGAEVTFAAGASPDTRNYRVSCDKLRRLVPAYRPRWTVRRGVEELHAAYREQALTEEEFLGVRFQRIKRIRELLGDGRLDASLRWRERAA